MNPQEKPRISQANRLTRAQKLQITQSELAKLREENEQAISENTVLKNEGYEKSALNPIKAFTPEAFADGYRNSLCSCGSGVKFKKCCYGTLKLNAR
jgi:uncharacterized protein YchJ